MKKEFLKNNELAERWGVDIRTLIRMRKAGLLPWLDLSGGKGARPIIRFRLQDVENYEAQMMQQCDSAFQKKQDSSIQSRT